MSRSRLATVGVAIVTVVVAACSSAATPAGSTGPSGSAGPAVSGASGAPSTAPSAGDPTKDQLAHILARGTLVGYAELDYPPQSIKVDGATRPSDTKCQANQLTAPEATGYDIETTKLVAKALGLEACFASPPFAEVVAGNWDDRLDIVYGSGSINADRMTRLWMTQPYYGVPNYYFVKADSTYRTAADLEGRQIGSCSGCSHEAYLKHELKIPGIDMIYDVADPTIVNYEGEGTGLQDVADGKIDAFLCAEPVGNAQIEAGLDLRHLDAISFTYFPSGFVDKGSGYAAGPFVARVNEIIRAAQADGTMKAMSMQWFGTDYATAGAEFDLDAAGQVVP